MAGRGEDEPLAAYRASDDVLDAMRLIQWDMGSPEAVYGLDIGGIGIGRREIRGDLDPEEVQAGRYANDKGQPHQDLGIGVSAVRSQNQNVILDRSGNAYFEIYLWRCG